MLGRFWVKIAVLSLLPFFPFFPFFLFFLCGIDELCYIHTIDKIKVTPLLSNPETTFDGERVGEGARRKIVKTIENNLKLSKKIQLALNIVVPMYEAIS